MNLLGILLRNKITGMTTTDFEELRKRSLDREKNTAPAREFGPRGEIWNL